MNFLFPNDFLQKIIEEKNMEIINFILQMAESTINNGGTVKIQYPKLMYENKTEITLETMADFENFRRTITELIS